MHIGKRIEVDKITDTNLTPEENLRKVLSYVKMHLGKEGKI